MVKRLLGAVSALALGCAAPALAQTLTITPIDERQSVAFGADIKLTLQRVDDGNSAAVMDRFVEMGFDMVRVPIFAMRTLQNPYDTYYDRVWRVSDLAEDRGLLIFASVANGDGGGTETHNAGKFHSSLICNCPYNIYSLNLTAYSAYLDTFIASMRLNDAAVTHLGPYNEDPADNSDYRKIWTQMQESGFARVGVESWALRGGTALTPDVRDQADVIGAHFYDDDVIADASEADEWAALVEAAQERPTWFTESSRYRKGNGQTTLQGLIDGLNHFIPAINGGVDRVIIYQAANRLVWYNGGYVANKGRGTGHFITHSRGNVVPSSLSGSTAMRTVSFVDGDMLHIHITNIDAIDQTVTVTFDDGFAANGLMTRTEWTSAGEGLTSVSSVVNDDSLSVPVLGTSYVHLSVPLVGRNTPLALSALANNSVTIINDGAGVASFETGVSIGAPVYVEGDVVVNSSTMGWSTSGGADALYATGDVTGTGGTVRNGANVVHGGTLTAPLTFYGGGQAFQDTTADFSDTERALRVLSADLERLPATDMVSLPGPTDAKTDVQLVATPDIHGVAVIDIADGNDLLSNPQIGSISLVTNGASTVVINVGGSVVTFDQGRFVNDTFAAATASTLIWNFHDATSFDASQRFPGTILAPNGVVTVRSWLAGAMVAEGGTAQKTVSPRAYAGAVGLTATLATP